MLRVLSLTALIMAATPAVAQNPQPTAPQNPTVPVAPLNGATPPPEQIAPPVKDPGASGNLSDRLARHNGTIKPPDVDPGMAVKPPPGAGGLTPVIPPPGSPGGNRSVVPK